MPPQFELTTPGFFAKTAIRGREARVLTGVGRSNRTVTGKSSGIYAYVPTSSLIDELNGRMWLKSTQSITMMSVGRVRV